MMKIKSFTLKLLSLCVLLALPPVGSADDGSWLSFKRLKGVAPVTDSQYLEECGACHFPYQPGLLPSRSWTRLLHAEALADHFGENAELDEETRQWLEDYAMKHAAEHSAYKRSRKIRSSLSGNDTPLRITEVPYIKDKHAAIPGRLISGNPQVRSLSNCNACHTRATAGIYDDDTVFIKGHGMWDD